MIASRDRYDWRHMYKGFIATADEDYKLTERKINHYNSLLKKVKFVLEEQRDLIQQLFGFYLYNYWEWNTDEPDPNHRLENTVDKVYAMFADAKQLKYGNLYTTFKRYFQIIGKIRENKNLLIRIKNRKKVSRKEYLEYLRRFYKEMMNEVLRGKIYKFDNRMGCLLIERVKPVDSEDDGKGNIIKRRRPVDWNATRIAKAKLIAEGKRPYNREEEMECIKKGIPYDGVKYLVYFDSEWHTRVIVIDATFKHRNVYRFVTASNKMTVTIDELLSKVNTVEDILALDLDLTTKLSLIKRLDKNYTIKYIRNNEQRTILHRKYYSPD